MRTLPDGIRAYDARHSLVDFHGRFADLCARSEPLSGVERRKSWQLAEHLGEAIQDGTQWLR